MSSHKLKQATITEYGAVGRDRLPVHDKYLCDQVSVKAFEALKRFNADNDDSIFTLSSVKAENGERIEALKAKSYVGVIETKCGTIVEILPKIYVHNKEGEKDKTREIFLKMLRFLKDSPFKEIDTARLHTTKHHLLEVFITLFMEDLTKLVQKGIARDYVNLEENQPFLKGKLLFSENIKHNLTHKERFYVSYDEFISNRPENRLIKSTLELLAKKSRLNSNQKRIREFIFTFDEVPYSKHIETDLSKIKNSRLIKHYEKVLSWCRVFLRNESFTNFKGKSVSLALLFPMERIFEDFVGAMFKRTFTGSDVFLQDKGKHLIERHAGLKKFALRPDIVIKSGDSPFVFDTKWKIINSNKPKENYWISQADMYQMFAYGKKYKSRELFLLYPKSDEFEESLDNFSYEDGMSLNVVPVDLEKAIEDKKIALDYIKNQL